MTSDLVVGRLRDRSAGRRRRLLRSAALVAIVLVSVACGADDVASGPLGTNPAGTEVPVTSPYVLLRAPQWDFSDAMDPKPDEPLTSNEQPPLEWWADYDRSTIGTPEPDSGSIGTVRSVERVRVSGHLASIDAFREQYERYGFVFSSASVDGRAAQVATSAPTEPAVLVVDFGPMTVLLLSYEVTTDELVQLAADLEPASAEDWLAAGGEIR